VKVPLVHIKCGKTAFLYEEDELVPGALMQSQCAELLDGSRPLSGDTMVCGSCGEEIGPYPSQELSR
jgi:hypothetical protein